jgi:hypothetical protein
VATEDAEQRAIGAEGEERKGRYALQAAVARLRLPL